MKKADDDFSAIDTITEELMKKKIDCVKYNYNLDPSVQNLAEFHNVLLDENKMNENLNEINRNNSRNCLEKEDFFKVNTPTTVNTTRLTGMKEFTFNNFKNSSINRFIGK